MKVSSLTVQNLYLCIFVCCVMELFEIGPWEKMVCASLWNGTSAIVEEFVVSITVGNADVAFMKVGYWAAAEKGVCNP